MFLSPPFKEHKMDFSEDTVKQAWNRAGGRCECKRKTHGHLDRCNKKLIWSKRGREDSGVWEAHHINRYGPDTLSDCEILCWNCHGKTL